MSKCLSRQSFVFILIILSSPAISQSESLDAIQVGATKDPSLFNFGATSQIPEDALVQRPLQPLTPLIEPIPAIITNQNGGPGSRVSYFIRGTESRHVSFTLDGLKLNDVSNTDRQFDAAFLSSAFIEQLTVYKGPQAVLFGSDAFGGLIDIRTRKGSRAPESRVSLGAGSFGTVGGSLSSDWKKNNHRGTLTYSQQQSDGLSRLNKKRFNAKEQDSSDVLQAASSSRHSWAKRYRTDLLISFLKGKNELDGLTTDNSRDTSENDQYILQQTTSHFVNKSTALSIRNGFNRHQRSIEMLSLGKPSFAGNLVQNEILWEKKHTASEFLGGFSSEHEEGQSSGIDRSFDLQSFFLQSFFKRGRFSFQAGGRIENHSRYGNFETGSTGISYEAHHHKFFLQYSQGFKAPSIFHLYSPDFGNRNLVPERNNSWETGWKLNQDHFGLDLTFFQNGLSNLITFTPSGYRNQGDFIAEGIEVEGRYSSAEWVFKPSFVHQNFRNEETEVLQRPVNSAAAQVSYFPIENLELYCSWRWYSSRKSLAPETTVKLNGFESLNVGTSYLIGKSNLSLQIINVLDRGYEEIYGYSIMPRAIFAGYGRSFSL